MEKARIKQLNNKDVSKAINYTGTSHHYVDWRSVEYTDGVVIMEDYDDTNMCDGFYTGIGANTAFGVLGTTTCQGRG